MNKIIILATFIFHLLPCSAIVYSAEEAPAEKSTITIEPIFNKESLIDYFNNDEFREKHKTYNISESGITVFLVGAVANEGFFVINEGTVLGNLINIAGGFDRLFNNRIYIANGPEIHRIKIDGGLNPADVKKISISPKNYP